MDFRNVTLKMSKDGFSDIGSIGNVKSPSKGANIDGKNKKEFEDFKKVCNKFGGEFSSSPYIKGVYSDDGVEIVLNFEASSGVPKTFRFFGMDVTDDLDVVVKGSMGVVRVGSLINYDVFSLLFKKIYPHMEDAVYRRMAESIDTESLKISLENFKFDFFMKLPPDMDNGGFVLGEDNLDFFNFFDNLIDDMKSKSRGKFRSVVLNFISEADVPEDSKALDDMDIKDIKSCVYGGMCRYFQELSSRYQWTSRVLAALDMFFNFHRKFYGVLATSDLVSKSTNGFGEIGLFVGFGKNGIDGSSFDFEVSRSFLNNMVELFAKNNETKLGYPISNYLSTMFEHPVDYDVSSLSRREALAMSVLDGLKYIDEDLELDVDVYNLDSDEERELLLRSVVKNFRNKFNTFYDDKGITLEEEIVNNVLPINKEDIDILGINLGGEKERLLDNDGGEVEISRVSFDKTNMMKACRLIGKVTKVLSKSFGSVS